MLAENVTSNERQHKEIYSTYGTKVLCSPVREDRQAIEPCSHEEADSRIVLHILDAANDGHEKILVRTGDTDVVVIIVSCLQNIPLKEIWVSFGVGKNHRYIAAHEIAASLGPRKGKALAMFHAFKGCDVTSFFSGKGKKLCGTLGLFSQKSPRHFCHQGMLQINCLRMH